MSDSSVTPQPSRLLCPWDFPGKILEWAAMPSSRGSSRPKNRTCLSCTADGVFTTERPRKPKKNVVYIRQQEINSGWKKKTSLKCNFLKLKQENPENKCELYALKRSFQLKSKIFKANSMLSIWSAHSTNWKNNQTQGMGIHFHAFDSQAAHTIMQWHLKKPQNSYNSQRPAISSLSAASSVLHIQQFAQLICAIP